MGRLVFCIGGTGGRILLRGSSLKPTKSAIGGGNFGTIEIECGGIVAISTVSIFSEMLTGGMADASIGVMAASAALIGCHGWSSRRGAVVNRLTSSFGSVGSAGVASPLVITLLLLVTGVRAVVVTGNVCCGSEMVR